MSTVNKFVLHISLALGIGWAAISLAQAQPNLPRMTKEGTVWEGKEIPDVSHLSQNPEPVEAFLNSLSDAQIYLHGDKINRAKAEIALAQTQLDEIAKLDQNKNSRVNRLDFMAFGFRKALELRIQGDLLPSPAIVPVGIWGRDVSRPSGQDEDLEALTIDEIENAIDKKGFDGSQVRDAEIRYIEFDVDYAFAGEELNEAIDHIDEGDFIAAQFDLVQTQISVVKHRNRILIPERMQARDNISLSRYLLGNDQYNAARRALDDARGAIARIENVPDLKNSKSEEEKVIAKIRGLQSKLDQEDPSLVDEIDRELDALWADLS